MSIRPELTVMLTYNDSTAENAWDIFCSCKDSKAQFWGFKEKPLPLPQMKKLFSYMKECGKTTVLEVVEYTEDECIKGAEAAVACGVYILMGTVYSDRVNELCQKHGIKYMPFVGKVTQRPSVLEGSIDEIIAEAEEYIKKGVYGFDLLGYRYTSDAAQLNRRFVEAVPLPVCLAGSVNSYKRLDEIKQAAGALECAERIIPRPELVALLDRAIVREPPALPNDGGFIAAGYDAALDALREDAGEGRRFIAEYQTREQQRTGIAKLRVKHVPAFGFLIEVPKGSVALVPPDYERRQTLVAAERYTTPELKDYERRTLGAQDRAVALERELLRNLVAAVAADAAPLQTAASALGELDALASFADRAIAAGYVRPEVDGSDVLEIEDGRHPIIEQLPDAEPFVPNSTFLNCSTDQIMLITGPNMAGKSTYIRQVATIAIMVHAGSWASASRMRAGVLDRVFTRIGAGDDLARGRSTFLVEMQETADILNNATEKSLVVLDEIGRGTSTFDGISIAWSVAEYLHGRAGSRAKTLFATHYHELAGLADSLAGVKNYTVKVKEDGGRIVFLRRIAPGVAEKSFGIHVGAMAGLPPEVVARAAQILEHLEESEMDLSGAGGQTGGGAPMPRRKSRGPASFPGQMTFF